MTQPDNLTAEQKRRPQAGDSSTRPPAFGNEYFRALIEHAPDMITVLDGAGVVRYESPAVKRVLGHQAAELIGEKVCAFIHPDDLPEAVEAFGRLRSRPGLSLSRELRFRHRDGSWRVLEVIATNLIEDPAVGGVVVNSRDITERRLTEEARGQLLRRIVTAQEEERRRVAHELHNQTSQHLTALGLGLKALKELSRGSAEVFAHARRLQGLTDRLMQEVYNLAGDLRPAALDDLGLRTALRRYVVEWSQRTGTAADFHCTGDNEQCLTPPTKIILYRVVQEALANVARHAQARRVGVLLEYRRDQVVAIVDDNGRGFDVEAVLKAANAERRLGLLGMQERLALVGGTLEIESTGGVGTTLFARIPVSHRGGER